MRKQFADVNETKKNSLQKLNIRTKIGRDDRDLWDTARHTK